MQTIPASLDSEAALLGSCLINPEAIHEAAVLVRPADFFRERNGWIFEAMLALNERREPIDYVLLTEELERRGHLGEIGHGYLTSLIATIPSGLYAVHYAKNVAETALRRRLIGAAGEIARIAYNEAEGADSLMDDAQELLFAVGSEAGGKTLDHIEGLTQSAINHIGLVEEGNQPAGLPTGFVALDTTLGGLGRGDLIILAARPAMGKCLGKGTKVLMFDGTLKRVEDVRKGDRLMGDDSTPRRVLSTAKGVDQLYLVKQTKGISYVVNSQHVLTLKRSRNEGTWHRGQVIDIALPDYLAKSTKWKSSFKGFKTAVDFPEQAVNMDPYILGLWLGDGTSASAAISNPDAEIVNALGEYAQGQGKHVHTYITPGKCPTHRVTEGMRQYQTQPSMQETLRSIGVLSNKHIPQNYLINSRQNRLELLAGLIDTDGYYTAKFNVFEIVMTNERMMRQIKFLADTLGFKTSFTEKSATIKSISYQTQAWRVRISGNLEDIPTRVTRKQARPLKTTRDWQVSGIEVEPVGMGEYFGFELDGNGRFLLEDMTVTHNTALSLTLAYNAAKLVNARVGFFSLEMSDDQITQRWLSMISGIDSTALRLGKVGGNQWPVLLDAANNLSMRSIYVDDTPALTVTDIRTRARRVWARDGLDLLVVDYLQLMRSTQRGENNHLEVSVMTKGLKALARELNIPIIALSQLNRGVESRSDKRPMLSDLRASGAIEEDADVVMFIYRDDYYHPETEAQGIAEIIVAKHRNGATGTSLLHFRKELALFRDLEVKRTDLNANY